MHVHAPGTGIASRPASPPALVARPRRAVGGRPALGRLLAQRAFAGRGTHAPWDPATLLDLQRSAGNTGVASLLVQRCEDGKVPPGGCHECGKPGPEEEAPVQRLVAGARPGAAGTAGAPGVQRAGPASVQRAGGRPTLRRGSRGAAVLDLQGRLNGRGAGLTADGVFGSATLGAVRSVQRGAGLAPDGVVGPKTWAALDGVGGAVQDGKPPSAAYLALVGRVGDAIAALRGAGRVGTGAAGTSLGARTATTAAWRRAATVALAGAVRDTSLLDAVAPQVATVQRDEGDEEESWWDQATSAVSDAAGAAADWAGDAAGAAADWASDAAESASEAADEWMGGGDGGGATQSAGGAGSSSAGGDDGGGSSGGFWDDVKNAASSGFAGTGQALDEAWSSASQAVSSLEDDAAALGEEIRREWGPQIAALEKAIGDLGKGLRLTDDEILALGEVVGDVLGSVDPGAAAAQAGGDKTCSNSEDISFTTSEFSVDFEGLADLHTKVVKKLGGAGHVKITSGPSLTPTCKTGTGDEATVDAHKIVAKGTASYPIPKDADQSKWKTQSADPAREKTGIANYFSISKSHEQAHVKIYKDAFTGLDFTGSSVKDAKAKLRSAECNAYGSQESLDNAEGCLVVTNGKDADKDKASECGLTPDYKAQAGC